MDQTPPESWSSFAQAIIETSTGPVVVFDASGVVAFANDAACRRFAAGPARLRFAARNEEGSAVVTVSDEGAGMDEELLARIFVRYERRSATGEGAAGTGLGMSIARQLIEAMHGTLEVESELGCGTTVTLRLPTSK